MIAGPYPTPILPSGQSTVRVAIVDPLRMPREALRFVLEAERGFAVVGAAPEGAEAINVVRAHRPDVLLLDAVTPRVGGLDTLRQLRDASIGVPTVVVGDAMKGIGALTLGARGILLKDACLSVLFRCLRAVAEGAYWVDNGRVRDAVDAFRRVREAGLPASAGAWTTRELQVIAAVVDGATNGDISLRLDVSVQTVKRLLRALFRKLGISRRLELALYAARHLFHDNRPAALPSCDCRV